MFCVPEASYRKYNMNSRMNSLLQDVQKEHLRVLKENSSLRQKMNTWNEADEIRKAKQEAEYYRSHALHNCSDAELETIIAFRKAHHKSCKNSGTYQFELYGTGIGEGIIIKCPVCGVQEDITDFGCW